MPQVLYLLAKTAEMMSTIELPSLQGEIDQTQVVVFAGGLGKRMGVTLPKALLRMGGQTLLDRCHDFFYNAGFSSFAFLLGFGHEKVFQRIKECGMYGTKTTIAVDPETEMGRAKSFKHALEAGAIDPTKRCVITYPDDVFTDHTLPRRILSEHLLAVTSLHTLGSLVLTRGMRWPYGTAELDQGGLVRQFVEKPLIFRPTSVGNYIFEPAVYDLVLDRIDAAHRGPLELEETLIPELSSMRKLYGILIPSQSWLPVNTPKDLEEAEKVLKGTNPTTTSRA